MAAVVVAGGEFDRQIDETELLIDRERRPHASVAGVRPRIFFPRVVAELSRLWNGVEDPEPPSCLHIERPNVALRVGLAARGIAGAVRSAHDHDVFGDNRAGVQTDLAVDEIKNLIVVLFEVYDAVLPKSLVRTAVLGVDR